MTLKTIYYIYLNRWGNIGESIVVIKATDSVMNLTWSLADDNSRLTYEFVFNSINTLHCENDILKESRFLKRELHWKYYSKSLLAEISQKSENKLLSTSL